MTEDNTKNQYTRVSMVAYFLKGNKRFFALGILCSLLVAFLDMLGPKIVQYTVDHIIGDETVSSAIVQQLINDAGGREYLRSHLYVIALFIIGIALTAGVSRYLYRLFNSIGAEGLIRRMRDLLFEHIEHLPYAWHGKNHTGDIIQRCTSDVETIKSFLSEQMTSLFRVGILIMLAMYFMIGIHPKMALISGIFIPIVILYSVFFHNRIAASFQHADEEEGVLSAIAQENLTGVRVVRAFGREQFERERFETQNEGYTKMWIRLMGWLSAFWCSNDLITGLQIMLVTVFGAVFCVKGMITVGEYIAFASYNGMLCWPVRELGRVISDMSKAGISVDRICYIMNSEREDVSEDPVIPLPQELGDIVFDHVSFAYEEGNDVVKDISFTIKKGSTLGILGGTGSGKSTLMYLLDRLYDLPEGCGRITIGGKDIKEYDRKELRRRIGLVLQEPFLFSRTIAENIAITKPQGPDMELVWHASRIAALDEAILKFSKGYNTEVGERGVTLSGGQKQRTAIAQVLMSDPPVMIFDDSLSAVDMETDAKIRKGLKENTKDATVVLISHRITTLMQADHIIVLDHGRIAEEGTHESLLKQDGLYAKIFDIQMAGAE
ncbi:MAG: ABC transporter ATP-binding protein [Lachnospiraceae bacterium]|nr:ABC transporter ATP-binding protein [Lachnospiraceae bacterium]